VNGESPAAQPAGRSENSSGDRQAASQQPPPAGRPAGAEQPSSGAGQPTEQELREAYEAELSRITSAEMALQAAVSLLNIGGYRLGLAAGPGESAGPERDLEQVRDAIDAVRGLMPVLERSMPAELAPLRDALARLQMTYAREAGAAAQEPAPPGPGERPDQPAAGPRPGAAPGAAAGEPSDAERNEPPKGPAEASGRLWVPGR
jgi:hypothetical protein